MEKYKVGDMLSINDTDYCILDIIPYHSEKYVVATEYVEKLMLKKPKIIMLREVPAEYESYGACFDLVNNQKEIESVLKRLEI